MGWLAMYVSMGHGLEFPNLGVTQYIKIVFI